MHQSHQSQSQSQSQSQPHRVDDDFKLFYEKNIRKHSFISILKTEHKIEEKSGKRWIEYDVEENALRKANEFKLFYEKNERKPSFISFPKSKQEKSETRLAQWFVHTKNAKKGKGLGIMFPSVEKILVDVIGEYWYENVTTWNKTLYKRWGYYPYSIKDDPVNPVNPLLYVYR